jgi:SAM-dependent methyltransferase
MSDDLTDYRLSWERKPVLRTIYSDFFTRLAGHCKPGRTLEIGGGIGNLKEMLSDVVSSDIQFSSHLDLVADAQSLPTGDNAFANIVMLDVLHHLEFPIRLLKDAMRTLEPGGRIVMIEPAITLGSSLFYRLIHHEPVRMSADPLIDGEPDPHRDPYDSNQAIPTLLATRYKARQQELVPGLKQHKAEWFSFLAYPLSGGFKPWSLISDAMVRRLLKMESYLERPLGRFFGFRVLIVFEKQDKE